MDKRISVDGSQGEGGGQILRTTLALAALLGREVEISRIRAKRPRPGLRPQHLATARALATITQGQLHGAHENSRELLFRPGRLKAGDYHFRIGTAGSVTLLLAALLPPLLMASGPSQLTIEGGTHVPFSPPFHYFSEVFLPLLGRLGVRATARLKSWGWYPAGGGEVRVTIEPCRQLQALDLLDRGPCQGLELTIGLAGLPAHIADREASQVRQRLGQMAGLTVLQAPAPSPGQGNLVFLKANYREMTAGFSALGQRGRPAERVADSVCDQWLAFEQSGATVDPHLADQIVLYCALAHGTSRFRVQPFTSHLLTNLAVIEQFLPARFEMDPDSGRLTVAGLDLLSREKDSKENGK